jgi:Ni/Fe-hydrogenase 1 B-type cytochrome subunit
MDIPQPGEQIVARSSDGERPANVALEDGETRETIFVWQWPVRLTHWVTAITLGFLTVTGIYIAHPFIQTIGPASSQYLMGTMRFIHFVTAFAFTISVLFRIYWAFTGNIYARWHQFLPIHPLRRQAMGRMLGFYFFFRREPPPTIGHNPLAGLTYTVVYVLFLIQVVTGFALFSLSFHGGFWPAVFGWVLLAFNVQPVRLLHTIIMYMLLAFTIHHVYSAILIDVEEQSGVVSSIISSYKTPMRRHITEVQAEETARIMDKRAGKPRQGNV